MPFKWIRSGRVLCRTSMGFKFEKDSAALKQRIRSDGTLRDQKALLILRGYEHMANI
jgi:hypothetical protein